MKILCITPDDLSTLIFCKTFSRLIAEHDDIELVTISGVVEGLKVDMYRKEIQRDVISKYIEIPMKRFISPLHDLIYFFNVYRAIKREQCSAVITFTTKPNIYGQFAARLAGVPVQIMAVRGLGRTFNDVSSIKEKLLQSLMITLYKYACKVTDKIWFTNTSDLNDFLGRKLITSNKVILTKNAVDLTDFCMERINKKTIQSLRKEFNLKDGDKVVVMVARLIEQKGIKEFAQSAISLSKRIPNLYFFLVAPEEPINPSMISAEYIRSIELKSNLKWLGFRKDVRELYALSDLSVLPSYYKEGGYPRALLEAMSYAKPVIAADTPECRGPVEHEKNGYIIPPRNHQALTEAISKIILDPELAYKMGQRSLAKMKNEFDDQVVFSTLLDEVLLLSR